VLLVEDEPFVREATCRTLEKAGFEVLPVGDAREAMQAYEYRHGKIDLLMTDMTLPGRSGRQLSQDLRISSAEIPVLLTSGYIENDWERQPREARMYFLPKPYTRAELVQALEKIFGSAAQRKSATQAS
jgi:two-component system cell cycle sensor histidine kinase/response regulator CckA